MAKKSEFGKKNIVNEWISSIENSFSSIQNFFSINVRKLILNFMLLVIDFRAPGIYSWALEVDLALNLEIGNWFSTVENISEKKEFFGPEGINSRRQ